MRSGVAPISFDKRMRTCFPALLTCTTSRTVWPVNTGALPGRGGPAGAAPQVAVHANGAPACAAGTIVRVAISTACRASSSEKFFIAVRRVGMLDDT